MKNNNRGFSLLELLIVVTIIGILAGIAYPSYTKSLVKASRGAAKAYLMEVAQKQQQFLLDNRAYGTEAEITALTPAPKEFTNFYTLTIATPAGNPPTFTATATPKAGTRQAGDGALSIDQAGTRLPADKW